MSERAITAPSPWSGVAAIHLVSEHTSLSITAALESHLRQDFCIVKLLIMRPSPPPATSSGENPCQNKAALPKRLPLRTRSAAPSWESGSVAVITISTFATAAERTRFA